MSCCGTEAVATLPIGADLFARAKAAADRIGPAAMSVATTERGVHVESTLVALGAVAGYACQVAARIAPPPFDPADGRRPIMEARGADGRIFYFGDAINHYLLEAPTSFWSLAAGGVPQSGGRPLPDIIAIVRHVAESVGGEGFGEIRFPPGTSAAFPPSHYLRLLWPGARERLTESGLAPEEWPIALGIAAQIMLLAVKPAMEPAAALAILAETAVVTSKIDPAPLGLGDR